MTNNLIKFLLTLTWLQFFINMCLGLCNIEPTGKITSKFSKKYVYTSNEDAIQYWYRLGKTRFYMFSTNNETDTKTINDKIIGQWSESAGRCKNFFHKNSIPPIRIDKVSTNALIARYLEYNVKKYKLNRYTYWIGAKSKDNAGGNYLWGNPLPGELAKDATKEYLVAYGNIFYKAPRPIGYTKVEAFPLDEEKSALEVHLSNEAGLEYVHNLSNPSSTDADRCLAFALPFKNNPNLGYQTSWVERPCNQKIPFLCEIRGNPDCEENHSLNPHVLTEDKEYYYTEGNWILSFRRFIVNWKPRNKTDAVEYCKKFNLVLFTPTAEDLCLVPSLKMWGMVISTYHFWTSYKFHQYEKLFYAEDKKTIVQRSKKKANRYASGRRGDEPHVYAKDEFVSVSYNWAYERKNETNCAGIDCDWMHYILAPILDNMRIGTICQHKEKSNKRPCHFEAAWNFNWRKALAPTAVVEFGYTGSQFWRSTYKQTFGSRLCGSDKDDRQMISHTTDYWTPFNTNPSKVEYLYDYQETYWVVDENLWENVGKHAPLCTVSNLTKSGDGWKRSLHKVYCDEWHFYLCEYVF